MKTYLKRFFIGLKVNRVIEYLTLSDIMMMSGWGLINPIFYRSIGTAFLAGVGRHIKRKNQKIQLA